MADVITIVQKVPYTVTVVQRQSVAVQSLRTVSTNVDSKELVTQTDASRERLTVERQTTTAIAVPGIQGPPGPKGDSGAAASVSLPVGAVIHGLRIVRAENGVAYPVDTSVELHAEQVAGLALQSVTVTGQPVNIQTAGPVTDSSWSWTAGTLWCGPDGSLTQSPAATGWIMPVARVLTSDTIQIDIDVPIYRD